MVTLHIKETSGWARDGQPCRVGVPVPSGLLPENAVAGLRDEYGRDWQCQSSVLSVWPDGSAKWILLDFLCSVDSMSERVCELYGARSGIDVGQKLIAKETNEGSQIVVETGALSCVVPIEGPILLECNSSNEGVASCTQALRLVLTDDMGQEHQGVCESRSLIENGPVRASIQLRGSFPSSKKAGVMQYTCVLSFFSGIATLEMEVDLWNPRAAIHPGNCWDLGDPGSIHFKDFSVCLELADQISTVKWISKPGEPESSQEGGYWCLYQDSSGGSNWNSPNHVDAWGRSSVSFPGYRISGGPDGKVIRSGARAEPEVRVTAGNALTAVALDNFWENFPKAIRSNEKSLTIGLFPIECAVGFELQGGERKCHKVFLEISSVNGGSNLRDLRFPPHLWVDPHWTESSQAVYGFSANEHSIDHKIYFDYVQSIADGPVSFAERREVIDEYGWRHFGETYADHEAARCPADQPLVSHYNNQYDFVFAAAFHYLRTGSESWRRLMKESARHHIDIDIYHTSEDLAVYNGGLFWHTDHYKPAATASHRTYSRSNGDGMTYGGGPSNEHNYTTGFLHFYYLTGDTSARTAVLTLADWVMAMDDGEQTVFSIASSAPTGKASSTVSPDFHGPGRGAGNSINALLDAYQLSMDRRYLAMAEELVERCIHPRDALEEMNLGEPEFRWSYLVFLQVLGKYLRIKAEWAECDYHFFYARDSLLHYARWMLDNEVPYKDVLDRVDLPTETWPAQDIRKCHVMHIASGLSYGGLSKQFREKAGYFYRRCLGDLMQFPTAYFARPRVILAVYGHIQSYAEQNGYFGPESAYSGAHGYKFKDRERFIPQRHRISKDFKHRIGLVVSAVRLRLRSRFWVLIQKFRRVRRERL